MLDHRWMLPILLGGLVLMGCQDISQSNPGTEVPPAQEETEPISPTTQDEAADAILTEVMAAINQGDAATLASYALRDFGDANMQAAEAAIADYQTYFEGEPVTRFERVGEAPYTPNTLQYNLFNESGKSKAIYVSFQQDTPAVYDEFLNYSGPAKAMLDSFIAAIQAEDAQRLARVLTPDDIDYPVKAAESVIGTYRDRIEPDTLTYEFIALDPETQHFIYQLSGTKDGQPVDHNVEIIYGDGLVGLRDEWVPSAS